VQRPNPPAQKSGEQEAQQGNNIQDIRSADQNSAAASQNAMDLANELRLILDVLDHFDQIDASKPPVRNGRKWFKSTRRLDQSLRATAAGSNNLSQPHHSPARTAVVRWRLFHNSDPAFDRRPSSARTRGERSRSG
jgi:hypothetical protein